MQTIQALEARIGWFRAVVGELQPILARIPSVIEQAVTARRADRAQVLDRLIADLQREIEEREASPLSLDEAAEPPPGGEEGAAPLTLPELEVALRTSSLGSRFTPHREIPGALQLDLGGEVWAVTFDPEIADAHPGLVRLLTPGEPLLAELLALVDAPAGQPAGRGVIRGAGGGLVRWNLPAGDGIEGVRTLAQLRARLDGPPEEVTARHVEHARQDLHNAIEAQQRRVESWERRQAEERRSVLQERARLALAVAVACCRVLDGLDDHQAAGHRVSSGYPFAGLAKLVGRAEPSDVEAAAAGLSSDNARRQLERAREEAKGLLRALASETQSGAVAATLNLETRVEIYGW